jgi:predicted GNAT superfamily acetyltransferase
MRIEAPLPEWSIRALDRPEDFAGWPALESACGRTGRVEAEFLAEMSRHGCKLLGIGAGNELWAAALGVLGEDQRSDRRVVQARLKLHLLLLMVHPARRRHGLATALLLGLRRAAELDGLPLITWELDPLDCQSAAFSFHRLGATSSGWLSEKAPARGSRMGPRRIEVDWWLHSRRVQSRAAARRQGLTLAHYLEAGAQQLNPAGLTASGMPTPSIQVEDASSPLALLELPTEWSEVRRLDAGLAAAWRAQVEGILEQAFGRGYWLTDLLVLENEQFPRAYFVLAAGDSTLG